MKIEKYKLLIYGFVICAILSYIVYSFLLVNKSIEMFNNKKHNIPRYIWLWWEQGWREAPEITKYTILSFKKHNPKWKIKLVSKENIFDFIDSKYKWLFNCEGAATRSDIIRIILLKKYGGVYSDAATVCCIDLDEFINKNNITEFWTPVLNHFHKTDSYISSWFIISTPNNYIVNTFSKKYLKYIKQNPKHHPYFSFHYNFNELIDNNLKFKEFYKNMRKISGFKNRIDTEILHLKMDDDIINDWLISHSFSPSFHPYDIKKKIDNNNFSIIKLRHKNINKNYLKNKNSVMNYIIKTYIN